MSQEKGDKLLNVYIQEFDKLKAEQTQRIGFRDNMLYVTLVAVGGALSFATTDSTHLYAFLVVPWICFVLGWAYLANDAKISAIGTYFRSGLTERIRAEVGDSDAIIFGWEEANKHEPRRAQRKFLQLLVDETTFCFSGMASVGAFYLLSGEVPLEVAAVCIVEFVLLAVLGVLIYFDSGLRELMKSPKKQARIN